MDTLGCPECRRRPPAFESVLAIGAYRRQLREAIHRLKFHGEWDLAFPLAQRLVSSASPAVDLLVPMPLHAARERERGYNQAQLITQVLSQGWHIPWRQVLCRLRPTQPQALLGRGERQANVAGAFAASRPLAIGGRVGLVDDVFTSGATAQAAAKVLLAAGAASVQVIVLARALPSPRLAARVRP